MLGLLGMVQGCTKDGEAEQRIRHGGSSAGTRGWRRGCRKVLRLLLMQPLPPQSTHCRHPSHTPATPLSPLWYWKVLIPRIALHTDLSCAFGNVAQP